MSVSVVLGDITASHVDAIVNAANCSLLGGSGDYLCTKQQELDDITRFMRSWRD